MPASGPVQIKPRNVVDSSQTANVGLGVQASQDAYARSSNAAFALINSLNDHAASISNTVSQVQARNKKAQDVVDMEGGKALANKQSITGEPSSEEAQAWLAKSDAALEGYHETTGILAGQKFSREMSTVVAGLDPDANIDQIVKQKSQEFIDAQGPLAPQARAVLLQSMAKSADALKTEFIKQSHDETVARLHDQVEAIAATGFEAGTMQQPGAIDNFYAYARKNNIHPADANVMIANAAASHLAIGKGNIEATLDALKASHPDGTPGVYWITGSKNGGANLRSQLDAAADKGLRVQKDAQVKQQADAYVANYNRLSDKAQYGGLTDSEITLLAKQFPDIVTNETRTGLHAMNRAGAIRAAKESEEKALKANADVVAASGDPVARASFAAAHGGSELTKADNRAFASATSGYLKAAMSKDENGKTEGLANFTRYLQQNAHTGAITPEVQAMYSSANPKNPEMFQALFALHQQAAMVNPQYADRMLSTEAKAQFSAYQTRVETMKMSPQAALSEMADVQPLDPDTVKRIGGKVAQANRDAPLDVVNDTKFLGFHVPFTGDRVTNEDFVREEIGKRYEDLLATGHYGSNQQKAWDEAKALVMAGRVPVGTELVPRAGMSDEGAKAANQLTIDTKANLVKRGVMTEDEGIFVAPVKGDPGKVQMIRRSGFSTPYPVTVEKEITDEQGHTRKVEVPLVFDPETLAAKHVAWVDQEKVKDVAVDKRIEQLDTTYSNIGKYQMKREWKKAAPNPNPATSVIPKGGIDPSLAPQSFIDFLSNTH